MSPDIKYHVACAVEEMPPEPEYEHNGAHCYCVKWRPLGAARAITYDLDAIDWAIDYVRKYGIEHPIFYVLACRIGPFIGTRTKAIHRLGGVLFVNPDGHEWKRSKWSAPIRKYWKISERGMVKHADLLICDSKEIEKYIQRDYAELSPVTVYISYGADTEPSKLTDDDPVFVDWLEKHEVEPDGYYLVLGRLVPENNYETIVREFMSTNVTRPLILITNECSDFLEQLRETTGFDSDSRIRFVGPEYRQELVKKIRENAHAYIHGHEVGGTNPSLLEALASTKVNLLLGVGFNREVAEDAALYWEKRNGALKSLLLCCESMPLKDIADFGVKSRGRITSNYAWGIIVSLYEALLIW